ncbi:MAG: RES domain-containing protein [Fuscovulum sp.]|nr:RES domain-containing protein [Fuscovulum sp.]
MPWTPAALPEHRFTGTLYRALNPLWMRQPLSGEGARRHGGRFNARGTPALYTALTPEGAIAEANQAGRPFEPVTLVAYRADVAPVLDTTDPAQAAAQGVDQGVLAADDWRLRMIEDGASDSQRLAARLIGAGWAGMIVPSFARGVRPGARNLVLWRWDGALQVIDSEGRLN